MNLSDAGESRVRGYLYMLDNSLRTFLRREVAADAVREVESHIRERVRETAPMPNERDALNRLLDELGPPHRLARAYSAELAVDEAVTSGKVVAVAMAIGKLALLTIEGFFAALGLFAGYMIGLACAVVAIARPFFPKNVGVVTINGKYLGAGFHLDLPPDSVVTLGWLVAGVCAVIAIVLLPVTHLLGRKYLRRVQARFRRRAEAA
jgi:uncharacterized membrane protein